MPHTEEGEEYDDIMSPKYTSASEVYLVPMPTNSTSAPGQKPLPPVPTACKGDHNSECMYEEMTGC